MPYDRIDPAQWWHGADPAPPMPDAPGPWALGATAYGWEWRRSEPDAPDPAQKAEYAWWHDLTAPLRGTVPGFPAPPAEVRVGDRLSHRYGSGPWTVRKVADAHAVVECGGAEVPAGLHNIGRAGADKLWTLLPRDPAPIPSGLPVVGLPPPSPDVQALTMEAINRRFGGRTPDPVPADLDADTAGILREGMRALDRIEAKAARQVHAGGRGGNVRHEAAAAGADSPPARVLWSRFRAADIAHEQALQEGRGGACAMLAALRAADAVPDPRREALERVVEAARALFPHRPRIVSATGDMLRLFDALDALAALDGEAGG